MTDPQRPDPRYDPAGPINPDGTPNSPYTDPAADPRVANQTVVQPASGRGGLIAAGVIAVLLVIALIAFTAGPNTDPGTTAVIPDEPAATEETPPAAAPADPAAPESGGGAETPIEEAPATPPADEAPAADQ